MKNIILIILFFTIYTNYILSQSKFEQYSVEIPDTSNQTIYPIYFKLIKKGYLIPNLKISTIENRFFFRDYFRTKIY